MAVRAHGALTSKGSFARAKQALKKSRLVQHRVQPVVLENAWNFHGETFPTWASILSLSLFFFFHHFLFVPALRRTHTYTHTHTHTRRSVFPPFCRPAAKSFRFNTPFKIRGCPFPGKYVGPLCPRTRNVIYADKCDEI